MIADLDRGQRAVGSCVDSDDVAGAAKLQKQLNARAFAAEKSRWNNDPTILSLAGYHRKNAYMIKHWYEYCAGEFPDDDLLKESRSWFFKRVLKNPLDYNALNGLGNIFLFQGELSAAEFFVSSAIKCARDNGVDYWEAKHDLELIRSRLKQQTQVSEAEDDGAGRLTYSPVRKGVRYPSKMFRGLRSILNPCVTFLVVQSTSYLDSRAQSSREVCKMLTQTATERWRDQRVN